LKSLSIKTYSLLTPVDDSLTLNQSLMTHSDTISLTQKKYTALTYFFQHYTKISDIQNNLTAFNNSTPEQLIKLYNTAIPLVEKTLWDNNLKELQLYQQLFHELESIHTELNNDTRHHFIITIPVADRPQHLQQCLQSILNLCHKYQYGGIENGQYKKIKVLVSDDSKQLENQQTNKTLALEFTNKGINVEYFGPAEQIAIINNAKSINKTLNNIIGNTSPDAFYHKGASITRNISYLKFNELNTSDNSTLFYFIDSDQEFQVNINNQTDDDNVYAVNYFYYLDKLFSTNQIDVLTGKVVGDPPVSPSVMAGNFLQDLIAFTSKIANYEPHTNCEFHPSNTLNVDDAAYHDMADLFGFKSSSESYQYNCMLEGQHDNAQCFAALCRKLSQFFDGEHPTRKSYYEYTNVEESITPARTIYTGNYIFNSKGLQHFIPFANLKLRMAGPVLGRIIKSIIGERFVSANLPMLHKRTVQAIQQSEFRPGVEHQENVIDLSGEFMRQFYGDVMLFSMQTLTELGYPKAQALEQKISAIVENTINSMKEKYTLKHIENIKKLDQLKSIINDPQHWWNQNAELTESKLHFTTFIQNIDYNFGSDAKVYSQLFSANNIERYQSEITTALLSYTNDQTSWTALLKEMQT